MGRPTIRSMAYHRPKTRHWNMPSGAASSSVPSNLNLENLTVSKTTTTKDLTVSDVSTLATADIVSCYVSGSLYANSGTINTISASNISSSVVNMASGTCTGALVSNSLGVSGGVTADTFFTSSGTYSSINNLYGTNLGYSSIQGDSIAAVVSVDSSKYYLNGVDLTTFYGTAPTANISLTTSRTLVMSIAIPVFGHYLVTSNLIFSALTNLTLWNATVEIGQYTLSGGVYTKVVSFFLLPSSYGGVASISGSHYFNIQLSNSYINVYVTASASCTLRGKASGDYYSLINARFQY